LADLTISGISRMSMAAGHRPTFCDARITPRKNLASSGVVGLIPSNTTGPWNCPDSTISRATVAPSEKPTTTSQSCSLASSPARRASAGTDTSPDAGAPALPGSVVATKRTPESAGSGITRLNDRAALAPPGSSRTD
jgi:hypothetical protein